MAGASAIDRWRDPSEKTLGVMLLARRSCCWR